MKQGFFYQRNNDNAAFHNFTVWVEGEAGNLVKVMGEAKAEQYKLVPYRCENCGAIEFYAPTAEKWKH